VFPGIRLPILAGLYFPWKWDCADKKKFKKIYLVAWPALAARPQHRRPAWHGICSIFQQQLVRVARAC
jgi:hypothetical protein